MKKSYEIIRDLREDRDLTQKDVADYLNMSRATYNHYELGHTNLTEDIIVKLAVFYHVTPNIILNFPSENEFYDVDFLKLHKKIKHSHTSVDYLISLIDLNEQYNEKSRIKPIKKLHV